MIAIIFSAIGVGVTILSCTWHLSSGISATNAGLEALKASVLLLKTNDLHHIEGRLAAIEKVLMGDKT